MRFAATPRRTAWVAGGLLLLVYVGTLAPSVTFWDAGEFIAAAHALGIPHPPGTPLFVLMLNTWAKLFAFLPFATATNLFSAVTTAAAGGMTAWLVVRGTQSRAAALATALCAGGMSSVWQNATETEVYAVSLALAVGAIVAADHVGRTGDRRWLALAAYLLALSIPLHLSALVAAPVVIQLASEREEGGIDWAAGVALAGVSIIVIGTSRLSPLMMLFGALVVALAPALTYEVNVREIARQRLALFGVVLFAFSGLLYLYLRAKHDPAINQGNPSSFDRLAYVVGREQYDLPGMWPRRAPLWIQIGNWFEYADWQVALSFAPTVIPGVMRILTTVAFVVLGWFGSQWHRRRDARSWRAVLLLFVCGSLGVIVYLNLKTGTSFAWQFVPDDAAHEARDRDYFFVLGFWAWGIWAGMGALAVAERLRMPRSLGLLVAALPIALNWNAVSRRGEPEASMPREVAKELLGPLPPKAVLFVSGDNDTYPLWYAQQVEQLRPDVTIVTLPLLGARWYADELMRRDSLAGPTPDRIAAMARGQGRPVAVAMTVDPDDRNQLAINWTVIGDVAVDTYSLGSSGQHLRVVMMDRKAIQAAAERIEKWRGGRTIRPSVDPVHDYFSRVLACPRMMLEKAPSPAVTAQLDSVCNLR